MFQVLSCPWADCPMNIKWPNNLSSKYIRPAGRIYLYKISVSYGDKAVKNGRICLPAVLLMLHAQPGTYAPMPDGAANQHILALWSQSLKFDCFQGRQKKAQEALHPLGTTQKTGKFTKGMRGIPCTLTL